MADLNGDGHQDLLVLDRATGSIRIAFDTRTQGYATGTSWCGSALRDALLGVGPGQRVPGAGSGTHASSPPSIALWSPSGNRIDFFHLDGSSAPARTIETEPLGMGLAVPIQPPPDRENPWVELVVASSAGSSPQIQVPMLARSGPAPAPGPAHSSSHVTMMSRGAGESWLMIYDTAQDSLRMESCETGLDRDARYAVGFLGDGPLATFLVHTPGEGSFVAFPLERTLTGKLAIDSRRTRRFGCGPHRIEQIAITESFPESRIIILFDQGTCAVIYSFNGEQPPVPMAELLPAAGRRFQCVLGSEQLGFKLLEGSGETTSHVAHWEWQGTRYALAANQTLPPVQPAPEPQQLRVPPRGIAQAQDVKEP